MSIMYGFGDSRLVMPRLSAGFFFGASHKKISLNSSVQLSLALPLHTVTARNGLGELTAGKKFFGMNLNAGIGFRLAEYRKEQIWLNSDFGYERLNNDFSIDWSNIFDDGEDDYLNDDDDDEISPKKINLQQFYPSLGIEWKRYHSYMKDRFTSYVLRFSLGDMNTGGGTKFKRGMISFHVRWGFY